MGQQHQGEKLKCVLAITVAFLLVTHSVGLANAKRTYSTSNRKTSSNSGSSYTPRNNGHVTQPTYNTNAGGSNSHADAAKLSYSNYNSQPNRPATGTATQQNTAPIGWNVPKQAGPPPAYSASNPVGGAKTNINEPAPAYHPNNAPPPSYGASNVHTPITATNTQGVQSGYPQQSYHPAAGAPGSYYPAGGQVPAGASYYPHGAPGGAPGGAPYYPAGGMSQPVSYIPAGGALPPGATFYSQPPQQSSSGLGFGSGLAAGAIGGAILGHVLTPTETKVVQQAPASSGGDGKVIIINNGPPGSVTTDATGNTVITSGAAGAAGAAGVAGANAAPAVPVVPLAPLSATNADNNTAAVQPMAAPAAPVPAPAPAPGQEPPPAGGIICVPMRVNETDPNDSTKMLEVEKIACYPAPPPAQVDPNAPQAVPAASAANTDSAPLAPMNPANGQVLQQMQQQPTSSTLLPENSSMRGNGATDSKGSMLLITLLGVIIALKAY